MSQTLTPSPAMPSRHRFTVDEYERMLVAGALNNDKVQLIDGEILSMPAQGELHFYVLWKIAKQLNSIFPDSHFWVRTQASLKLAGHVPDPDIVVLPGAPASLGKVFNETPPLLVIEVSDSTLKYDLDEKASLYAAASVADYWVADVNTKAILVHRAPRPDAPSRFGAAYTDVTRHETNGAISPLAAPNSKVVIEDCFS